jgi:hypothetical protein
MRSIPPNVLSGLVPYVKVYKVVYPYRLATQNFSFPGAAGGFKNEDFESLSKTLDVEVPFDYGVDPLDLNFNPKTSILQGRPKGYLDIANLVSFDYQYNGTNPAEQEVCITAKMKLKFSTIGNGVDILTSIKVTKTMDASDDKGNQLGITLNSTQIKLTGYNNFNK